MSKLARKIQKYGDGGTIGGIRLSGPEYERIKSLDARARTAALHQVIGHTPKYTNPHPNSPQWHEDNDSFNNAVKTAP
ncbi:MAG: hypothetical protein AABY22_08875 [Nanoarchaeota archaeon]